MSPLLEVNRLLVRRGPRLVLDIEHLALDAGEALAVIGPNGAGKSTLLLVLSRLLRPDRGTIHFREAPLAALSDLDYRRRIALVLQDPLLIDASVYENVALGLRFRHAPKKEIAPRVDEWLGKFGIAQLRHRPSRELSGGEAQRVSLARAMALEPDLLLLDEPFGALDAPTRLRLLQDFHSLLASTATATLFVTHDLDEALLLGDSVAVILNGRLRQHGTPQQVFASPADEEVGAFVGMETVIEGRVSASQNGEVAVEAGGAMLYSVGDAAVGQRVLLCLRPEDITLWPSSESPRSSARNRIVGRVQRRYPQGPLLRVVLDCGFPVTALVTHASADELELEPGQAIAATFKASAVHVVLK